MEVFLHPIESMLAVLIGCTAIGMVIKHGVAELLKRAAWFLWKLAIAWERGWSAAVVGFRSVGAE